MSSSSAVWVELVGWLHRGGRSGFAVHYQRHGRECQHAHSVDCSCRSCKTTQLIERPDAPQADAHGEIRQLLKKERADTHRDEGDDVAGQVQASWYPSRRPHNDNQQQRRFEEDRKRLPKRRLQLQDTDWTQGESGAKDDTKIQYRGGDHMCHLLLDGSALPDMANS